MRSSRRLADRILHLAPATFDPATFEIWGALLNGAQLVVAPPGEFPAGTAGELWGARAVRDR